MRLLEPVTFACCLLSAVSAGAQEDDPQLTPEAAMAVLVKELPGLKEVDTWDGGWLEAKLDRAGTDGRCRLTTDAPFGLIHDQAGTHELNRQHWHLDFSSVTGVGQRDGRMIFKIKRADLVLGYDAGDPQIALRLANAFDTLRRACVSVPPPDNSDTPDD